ncbi:CGNR zinc finger domain-containing protein [Actinomadura litoris]|uniref:CGNR zinc finger domain-containing protein n=1 Tax=Actinomadura litoris TaxID=2678616 RepID=UPI001FA6FC38|nr:CGNR zinc finger domain-containing protein [Actinomadura litoris]
MGTEEFRFDCGAVWLDLLATKARSFSAAPVERIGDPGRLALWLERCDLAPQAPPSAADLEAAVGVRETLRVLALAAVREDPPPRDAVAALEGFLAGHEEPIRFVPGGRLRREPPATTLAALARIARQAADHLTGADRRALKVCPEPDCRGVFTDPPGRRRWCPSPACASRGRVRALRARREAAAG